MNFIKKNPIIFAISGKAGSGKNEISKIISKYYNDKKVITISYGEYLKNYVKNISSWDGNENTKPRDLLQQLGIELIKNKINKNLLIDRILDDIKVYSYFFDIIIISDVRLQDELESIKNNYPNSISIRVNRLNYNNKLTDNEKKHLTEINLDNYNNFDYLLVNDDLLEEKLLKILGGIK